MENHLQLLELRLNTQTRKDKSFEVDDQTLGVYVEHDGRIVAVCELPIEPNVNFHYKQL
jgi:hypothetical protein